MTATIRFGRVTMKASTTPASYESVLVKEEDGSLYYYHGGSTCCTADGWVSLSEDYRSEIVWKYRPEPLRRDARTSRPNSP